MRCVVEIGAVAAVFVQSGRIVASAAGPFSEIASKKNSSSLNSGSMEPQEVSIAAEEPTEFEYAGTKNSWSFVFLLTAFRRPDAAIGADLATILFFKIVPVVVFVRIILFFGLYFGVFNVGAARGTAFSALWGALARQRGTFGKTGGLGCDPGVV